MNRITAVLRKSTISFAALSLLLFLGSCEKVVNIDLNNASPQYVIEGEMFDGTHPLRITVARTTDYYGRQPQTFVSDAVVTLTQPDGTAIAIPSIGSGIYELPSFTAVIGNTYALKVQAGGHEFTASTTVPAPVPFDTIMYEYKDNGFFDPGYEVTGYITDPAGTGNNYRGILTVNDTTRSDIGDIFLFDDKYNDGKPISLDPFERFQIGDTISMEVRTMDRPVYDFFTTLAEALSNGDGGPAPANPLTNIKGGALGYFGAFGVSRAGVRIRE